MSVNYNPLSVVSGYNVVSINTNFTSLTTVLQDAVSRSGNTPNHMLADFDMNGNNILNLPTPVNPGDVVRFQDISSIAADRAAAAASANAAEQSATESAASATSALNSATNIAENEKSIGWTFDDSTTVEDPGNMMLRFNNASLASVTSIIVDSNDIFNNDVSAYVVTWGSSTNAIKGTITIRKPDSTSDFAIYTVSGAVVDSTGWLTIPVSYVESSGSFSDEDRVLLHFTRAGDQGASGVGSGDLVSTNNLSDLANAATARTNLGLGSLATSNSVTDAQINNNAVTEDKILNDAVTADKIADNAVGADQLASTGVIAGSYTNVNVTVDEDGRISTISNGTVGTAMQITSVGPLVASSGNTFTFPAAFTNRNYMVTLVATCTTAHDGFSVGDVIDLDKYISTHAGITIVKDVNSVSVEMGLRIVYISPVTKLGANLILNNWDFQVVGIGVLA